MSSSQQSAYDHSSPCHHTILSSLVACLLYDFLVQSGDRGHSPEKSVEVVRMTTTATSPDPALPYNGKSDFEVDYPPTKQPPKQKTRIIYDIGSPEMNSQGINASIPITTDKYTYTITSVLSSTIKQQNSPLSSPTSSLSKRPISAARVNKSNAKIGKISGRYVELK